MKNGNFKRQLLSCGVITAALFATSFAHGETLGGQDTYDLNISSQRTDKALLKLAQDAGIRIIFPSSKVKTSQSPSIRGEVTIEQALEQMLYNTDLTYEETSKGLIVVKERPKILSDKISYNKAGNDQMAYLASYSEVENDGGGILPIAAAQQQAAAQQIPNVPDEENEDRADTIIVVGSQIKGASVTEALPVSVLGRAEIEATGATDGAEFFRTLPAAGAVSFGASNTRAITGGVNGSRGDVSSINLRSLGTGNTLVLLNGRRLVNHPGFQTDPPGLVPTVTVNMNTIPVMGIDRVEVLSDGASAIYGTDAVAGVINNVLRDDFTGLETSIRYGSSIGSRLRDITYNVHGGFDFADGKGNLSFSVNRVDRKGMLTSDRDYARTSDLRHLVEGTDFEGDTNFRNTSTTTPWGAFDLPGGQITLFGDDDRPITNGSGKFHLQPIGTIGCLEDFRDGLCFDGGSLGSGGEGHEDDELRYDGNAGPRSMSPDVVRTNIYSMLTYEFENNWEAYTEFGYFETSSKFQRAFGNSPLGSHPITIPAHNYWNPFGPITFADGRPNPNRLPGLTLDQVPAEGLDIPYPGGTNYRILERDRVVNVSDESFRIVQGFRGEYQGWDFDTGFVYSSAETLDRTNNRVSNTLFSRAIGLDTPDAYNPFNGAGTDIEAAQYSDGTPNPNENVHQFYIDVDRFSKSTMRLADFKVSNADVAELPGGNIGVSFGIEHRRIAYLDDRDDRLDFSVQYTNPVTGLTYGSDVMNSSPTSDTSGARNTISAFGEIAIPVVSPEMDIPFLYSFDIQLAGRYESFSDETTDFSGSVFAPRVAMSWYPIEEFQFRGSYSEGFRAPNLPQTNDGVQARVRGATDWYFCQAAVNRNDDDSDGDTGIDFRNINAYGDCNAEGSGNEFGASVQRLASGSEDLEPETSTSLSLGAVWEPSFIDNLTLTVDWWRIRQDGIIGLFGAPNHVSYDWALRMSGMDPNPNVIRDAPTGDNLAWFENSGLAPVGQVVDVLDKYLNLDKRETTGLDIRFLYNIPDTDIGSFRIGAQASKLIKADQVVGEQGEFINSQGNASVTVAGGGNLIEQDQRPKWRATGSINWTSVDGVWGASLFARYIGGVNDTSAIQDGTGTADIDPVYWRVDDWLTFNTSLSYTFDDGAMEGARIQVGMNNIFDVDPPIADDNFGYVPQLHNALGRYVYGTVRYEF